MYIIGLFCAQARQATKNFSQSDWCKKFSIVFRGEEGRQEERGMEGGWEGGRTSRKEREYEGRNDECG